MDISKENTPICIKNWTVRDKLRHRFDRVLAGLDTPLEFILLCLDNGLKSLLGINPRWQRKLFAHRILRSRLNIRHKSAQENFYQFKKIKIPRLNSDMEREFFGQSYEDDFFCYLNLDDNYKEKDINKYYYLLMEGPYCLCNDLVDVRVKQGDVVFDVGSWIGDFAAYAASAKGAIVYAFEPMESNYLILKKTAELNPGIIPIFQALGDVNASLGMRAGDITGGGKLVGRIFREQCFCLNSGCFC